MKRHIPNAITLLNLGAGVVGLSLVASDNLVCAAYFMILAGVFDLLDGFAARLLGLVSPIGKDLDSLADMISFGVLPAFILHSILEQAGWLSWLPLLVIPSLSALRLAKFNTDTSQSIIFKGLPTPAAALLLGTWPLSVSCGSGLFADLMAWLIQNPEAGAITATILAFFMVIPMKMLSFKFDVKKGLRSDPYFRMKLWYIGFSLIVAIYSPCAAFFPLILLYIFFSSMMPLINKKADH